MKKIIPLASVLISLAILVLLEDAQARMGGGRSYGSRGSRGFVTRSAPSPMYSNPYRAAPQPQQTNPYGRVGGATTPLQSAPSWGGGGGIFRGMLGGLAGGFLGSMLFRNMGWGSGMSGGLGGSSGFGMLEMILLGVVAFFLIRFIMGKLAARSVTEAQQFPVDRSTAYSTEQSPTIPPQGASARDMDEAEVTQALRRYDPSFDSQAFKQSRMDDFFRVQAGWANRDLERVKELFTPDLYSALSAETSKLRAEGRVNKLENIAFRDSQLVEGWQEMGKEYVTLWLRANVLDYTLDEKSGAVVSGSREEPTFFEEYWTYCREAGSPSSPWRLSAIEQVGRA